MAMNLMNFVTRKVGVKHELLLNKLASGTVEQKLLLRCSCRWDQDCNNHCYDFGHTSLCRMSLT